MSITFEEFIDAVEHDILIASDCNLLETECWVDWGIGSGILFDAWCGFMGKKWNLRIKRTANKIMERPLHEDAFIDGDLVLTRMEYFLQEYDRKMATGRAI